MRPLADFGAAHVPGSVSHPAAGRVRHLAGLAAAGRDGRWSSSATPTRTPPRSCGRRARSGTTTSPASSTAAIAAWTEAGRATTLDARRRRRRLDGSRVLDVRQDNEFAAGHVPGAVHVELGDLARAAHGVSDGPVVVMCGHGERAMGAASLLERAGHDRVAVLEGGPDQTGPRPPAAARGHRMSDRHPRVGRSPRRLGLRQNAAQFALLVAVNALVGGMLGQERTVLPLLAEREFGLTAYTAGLTFIARLRRRPRPPPTTSPAPGRTATAASPSWWPAG